MLALPHAAELEYVLLEVVPVGARPARAEAEERIHVAADQVRARGAKAAEVVVLEANDPVAAITGAVPEALVELIAMSTRGAGGLRRLVLGSVAEDGVQLSEVPVMLLTPGFLDMGQGR